jgi:hypothetical protein
MNSNVGVSGVRFWQWLLPALCAAAFISSLCLFVSAFGLIVRPWLGYWDSLTVPTGQPFIVRIDQSVAGGATSRAGVRDGDRIDLRDLNSYERAALFFQPLTTKPVTLVIRRGDKTLAARVVPSTQYEAESFSKVVPNALLFVADLWITGCALLVGLRRWRTREGRLLCLMLLAFVGAANFGSTALAIPSSVLYLIGGIFSACTALLPVILAAGFGTRSIVRKLLELGSFAAVALSLFGYAASALGIYNAAIDPLPFVYGGWRLFYTLPYALALITVSEAIATAVKSERARAAWLLLPLPISLLLYTVAEQLTANAPTWEGFMILSAVAVGSMLAGAAAVTYALLKRRVLDLGFVIGRALVVACISAIVVVSFVLLEWLLGTVLASASHATGLVANAALALVLGLSMSFIHKRVDGFVDFVFFHKRHQDEIALRDFAGEAAFVTDPADLLDLVIETVRVRTDASAAAVILDFGGRFSPARWFGESPAEASENDALILALKAKHAPVDPHRYATALFGDLAFPLSSRGRLLGILLCGARTSGEAYSPDEVDALREMSQGVGSALGLLERADGAQSRDDAILTELRALRTSVDALARERDALS